MKFETVSKNIIKQFKKAVFNVLRKKYGVNDNEIFNRLKIDADNGDVISLETYYLLKYADSSIGPRKFELDGDSIVITNNLDRYHIPRMMDLLYILLSKDETYE